MLRLPRWRVILVIVVSIFGIVFAAPNLIPANIRASLPPFMQQTLNLGLDLQGGSHLLLEVDTSELKRGQLDNIADQMFAALRDATPAIHVAGRGVVGDAARVRVVDQADMSRAMSALRRLTHDQASGQEVVVLSQPGDGWIEARMTEQALRQLRRDAAQQSIEVIRRRVDPTGANEINPVRQGEDRIVVQAPGISDPEQLKELIGHTALLTFHMVHPSASTADAAVPAGYMIAPGSEGVGPEVVRRRPSLSGEHLS